MRTPSVTLLPLILLTLLAGVSFWLERATQMENNPTGKRQHKPDFIVDHFVVRRYNLDGQVQHTLAAKQMQHYVDDDSTELIEPELVYFGQAQPTQMSARRASLTRDGKEVTLREDVRVLRAEQVGQAELRIETNELHILPDQETASTNQPVRIVNGRSEIHGKGLKADHRKQMYTLLGRVRGTIQPNSSK